MTSIDIVLPYYNGSAFIKEQISSVLLSQLDEIEVKFIIINDASDSDETRYLREILPSNHIYIENEVNLGVIKSIEKGLQHSTSPYVMLCDQDDVWLPNKIKDSLSKLMTTEEDKPTLVFTDLKIVGTKLEELHPSMLSYYRYSYEKFYPSILFQNIVTGCTVIMNRKLIDLALPFPNNIPMHDHWLACCAAFMGKLVCLNSSTILYRQHGNNQIGAPLGSKFGKILFLKKTLKIHQRNISQKIDMVEALAARLKANNMIMSYEFVQRVAVAFKQNDFLFLFKKRVISGSASRVVSALILFTYLKFKKTKNNFKIKA